jgi:hypothetical protein
LILGEDDDLQEAPGRVDEEAAQVKLYEMAQLFLGPGSSFDPSPLDAAAVQFGTRQPRDGSLTRGDADTGRQGRFTRGLEIIEVAGDHLSLIREEGNVAALAREISVPGRLPRCSGGSVISETFGSYGARRLLTFLPGDHPLAAHISVLSSTGSTWATRKSVSATAGRPRTACQGRQSRHLPERLVWFRTGAPEEIRTPDPQIRRMVYEPHARPCAYISIR